MGWPSASKISIRPPLAVVPEFTRTILDAQPPPNAHSGCMVVPDGVGGEPSVCNVLNCVPENCKPAKENADGLCTRRYPLKDVGAWLAVKNSFTNLATCCFAATVQVVVATVTPAESCNASDMPF